jgi:hypoxanthine phosphoribosyltransferase
MLLSILDQLSKRNLYLVAVSGGADSMALLDILFKRGFKLHIAHVNYKTRVSSDFEQELVEKYAHKYKIPITILVAPKHREGNFEEFARNVRYDFFASTAKKVKARGVFVGHHKDDLLETYLIQKRRGGIVSFYGLKDKTDIKGLTVIRPLLHLDKEQIIEYCLKHSIPYHDDESNLSNKYLRNRIRHNIVDKMSRLEKEEMLAKINKENEVLYKIDQRCLKNMKECVTNNVIDLKCFKKLNQEDAFYLLNKYIRINTNYEKINLSKAYLKELVRLLKTGKGSKSWNIGQNFELLKDYNSVFLIKKMYNISYKYVVYEGEYPSSDYFVSSNHGHPHVGVYVTKEDFPLTIRPYQSQDKIKIKEGYKKINRVYIDSKVNKKLREVYPIVLNKKGEVLLVPSLIKSYDRHNKEDNYFVRFRLQEVYEMSMNNDIKEVLISHEQIINRCKEISEEINRDYEGKTPILLGILKGSIPFMAEILKGLNIYAQTEYMVVSSYYGGTTSTGEVQIVKDLDVSVLNRDVIIIEDIIDSGITLQAVISLLNHRGARSVEVATMLSKKVARMVDIKPKYIGFEVENKFVVGFGLDYDELYRNLPYIGVLKEEVYTRR